MLAAVGLAALAASAPALALAQQQIVLTQDGGCTLGGVGSVAHVTAHYTASDGGKTAGLSFNLRFDPTEFAVVGKAEAGLPECAVGCQAPRWRPAARASAPPARWPRFQCCGARDHRACRPSLPNPRAEFRRS